MKVFQILYLKMRSYSIPLFCFLLLITCFSACKKTDNFYKELQDLPQLDVSPDHAYKTAYIVGDTMTITGNPALKNKLQISIGGKPATIIKIDSIASGTTDANGAKGYLTQASLLISAEMEGKAREVKITSNGYSTLGPAIDVYTEGGEGSFNTALGNVQIATLSGTYKMLYCVNGKGDVYYYAPATKDLRHIKKDGTQEIVYDMSNLSVNSFLAGGVDPNGNYLYFSIQTASGYVLDKLDLKNKTLTTLNNSTELASPYEGVVNTVKMIATGIYPDAKGNLYLAIGLGDQNVPNAIGRYNVANNTVSYIYKQVSFSAGSYADMPGVALNASNNVTGLRYSPDENLLYVLQNSYLDRASAVITVIDLSARLKLQEFTTRNSNDDASQYQAIAPFSGLKINMRDGSDPDYSFGLMPMPGQRLQTMIYQRYEQAASYGFPKWIVFDFANKRTYAYAPGQYQQGSNYSFRTTDQLLNYDEDGNLYMTSNGMSYLLRTQAQ